MTDSLTARFEAHRAHLRAVAYRMLGTTAEADDAVQEAWLRMHRADTEAVDNLGGWLTTVVARVCLDQLRARTSRRQVDLPPEQVAVADADASPDAAARLADSLGVALVLVLDALAPAERIAFVLHDVFDVPFDDIAPVVERTPTATRQLASRARRRIQGLTEVSARDRERQRAVVDAFLAASRSGDFEALLALLDPDVVMRADAAAVAAAVGRAGAPVVLPELRGAALVADSFRGRARAARPCMVDGRAAATWIHQGAVAAVFTFTFAADRIASIEIVLDPAHLDEFDVVVG